MLRKFMSPQEILQRMPDSEGGGPTIKSVNDVVLQIKSDAEKAQAAIKKQIDDLEASIKAAATAEALKALQAQLDEAKAALKTVDDYAKSLEQKYKSGDNHGSNFKSMSQRINDAIKTGWDSIKSFMNTNPGQRLRLQLFDEQEVKAAADMGIANIVNLGTALTTVLPGIDTLPNTAVHLRQIIPVGAMSGPSLTYMRETGGEGAPAPWTENSGAKAQLDRDFIEITVDAQYIAGWLRVSRKMLDDVVAFRSFLSTRMIEMYFDVEDEEVLNGTGVAPRLTGLLPNATPAVSTTGPAIERIVRAIGQAEASKYPADGIIMHPQDIVEIMLNKAAGSGEYDLPGMVVIQGGRLYIMGVPVFKTTAMPRGQYLVGAFRRGCMLFIRDNPSIEFFDQDRDNVITNKITVRIEGRAALAIFRVEAFVKGSFTIVT